MQGSEFPETYMSNGFAVKLKGHCLLKSSAAFPSKETAPIKNPQRSDHRGFSFCVYVASPDIKLKTCYRLVLDTAMTEGCPDVRLGSLPYSIDAISTI
jgi:hypothetical protein